MGMIDEIRGVFERCDLFLNGNIISKEPVVKDYWAYLCELAKKEHSFGAVLHTGSSVYDAVLLYFCTLLTIANRDTDNRSTVLNLSKGDKVIYTDSSGKIQRYIFDSIYTKNVLIKGRPSKQRFAKLIQDGEKKGGTAEVIEKRWGMISPYFGMSDSHDGKGLKKGNQRVHNFYHSVLGMEKPNHIDASAVIICSKQYYESLFDACIISLGKISIPLSEIATAAFYTDNNEIRHSGNKAQAEPMLKFTSSVEVARKEILNRSGNSVCGVFALEGEMISRNLSQFPQIINSKRLPLFAFSLRIDSPATDDLDTLSEKAIEYFACTKSYIRSLNKNPAVNNPVTAELHTQFSRVVSHESKTIVIDDIFKKTGYSSLLSLLRVIKQDEYSSNEKDQFVMSSYFLIKLLITAVFPLGELNSLIDERKLEMIPFSQRLEDMNKQILVFPEYLKRKAEEIISGIKEGYDEIELRNEKERKLKEIITEYHNKKVAVLINRNYYETVLNETNIRSLVNSLGSLTITTPTRLDQHQGYDAIIATSGYYGEKFNPAECISAPNIYTILYGCELAYYIGIKKQHLKKLAVYEKRNDNNDFEDDYYRESAWLDEYREAEQEYTSVRESDREIEDFIRHNNQKADFRQYMRYGSASVTEADTVAVALFENDAKAFFTKMYKAYVFDEENSTVREVLAENLKEGDRLLFFRSSEQSQDLVENLLKHLIDSERLGEKDRKSYIMSKRWKSDLVEYMETHHLAVREIAAGLKSQGVTVEEISIRQWLDEGSHIVGPKDPENLKYIGRYTGDEELENRYESYYAACSEVRSIRRRIQNYIGAAIVKRLLGEKPKDDEIYNMIYDDVETLGELLEITYIAKSDNKVPVNMINRPLTVRE